MSQLDDAVDEEVTSVVSFEPVQNARSILSKSIANRCRCPSDDFPVPKSSIASLTPGAPFGGYGQSGNGREGGAWGIEESAKAESVSG